MRSKRNKKSGSLQLNFRERTESKKIQNVSNLKKGDKIYNQIVNDVYKKGRSSGDIRNLTIRIEGGYSSSSYYRRQKDGLETDKHYYFGFTTSPDKIYTPKQIKEEIAKAMQDFQEVVNQNSEKYGLVAPPRISKVQVDFNMLKI